MGCGASPTLGWLNFDNSPTVLLGRVAPITKAFWLIGPDRIAFLEHAARGDIRHADCTAMPLATNSVDALYSSHMLEHLDRREAQRFLKEIHRVLRPGGILRIAVPDLKQRVERYTTDQDADAFIESLQVCEAKPRGLLARLKSMLIGGRQHFWMYDARSLRKLLEESGFVKATELPPGQTTIADPGALNLAERAEESIYVEAVRP